MITKSSAPSNIALIKYMGKIEGLGNRPTNASISWTMEHLRTSVEISPIQSQQDQWQPLGNLKLKQAGIEKFLKHFQFLKSKWNIQESFLVKSGNNFPSDCGLASSASSFAALTLTSAELFQQMNPQEWGEDKIELSKLSRQGSGSSCRSFFSPWALWKDEGAEKIELPLNFEHAVIVLESGVKQVSSSEAHRRVVTSPRFQGRIKRAEDKLKDLISAIEQNDWKQGYEIVWDEFWDMHQLFHTSQPPFKYMTQKAELILEWSRNEWKKEKHGPWITLDAGPNIHLLFEKSDKKFASKYLEKFKDEQVLKSWN